MLAFFFKPKIDNNIIYYTRTIVRYLRTKEDGYKDAIAWMDTTW